ncbi:MAG: RpiB/LacA/LacB family sugar-phosphate isomerase [Candidatus Doudnabacteria bacterium]
MIYLASDHGGFTLKEQLKKFLQKQKLPVIDLGPSKKNPNDDYPDYAAKVSQKVSKNLLSDVGILICRSGQGVCISANKFKGIRAALVWNTAEAKASRNDDMANILCLPSDYISPSQAEKIVLAWLETPYSDDERHMRRVQKISNLEK